MTDYRREDDDDGELKASEGGGMSFLEHLEDFRWTVGRSVLAFITGIVLATLFVSVAVIERLLLKMSEEFGGCADKSNWAESGL